MAPQHPFVPHAAPVERDPLKKPRPKLLEKRKAARDRERNWQRIRAQAFARDGYLCRVCQKNRPFDGHHVLARSLGGKDEIGNVISVCRRCHEDIHGHVVKVRWSNEKNRAQSLRIERVA